MLVGATYAASGDEVRLSGRSADVVPGLVLQALAVDSILSGFPIRDVPRWTIFAAVSLLAAVVSAAILLQRRLTHSFVMLIVIVLVVRRCRVPAVFQEREYPACCGSAGSDRSGCSPGAGPALFDFEDSNVMTASAVLAAVVCAVVFVPASLRQQTVQTQAKPAAALVSALSGSASVNQPTRTPLKLFDWIRAGATVDVPRGSELTLVLSNGSRFELTGPARATVKADGLSARSGSVRDLPALPRLPNVAPITNRKQEGAQSAAVRVRGPRISKLYPFDGAVSALPRLRSSSSSASREPRSMHSRSKTARERAYSKRRRRRHEYACPTR